MDDQTLSYYQTNATSIATQYRSDMPERLHALMRAHFRPGAPTADIGCGSGRDVHWLKGAGFPVVGYDAATMLLDEARKAFPDIEVREAVLPELAAIPDATYTNVLCSATLMHLPAAAMIAAVQNLARITASNGCLVVSVRGSTTATSREPDGRLFTPLPTGRLTLLLEAVGFVVEQTLEHPDTNRSHITWTTLVARRSPLNVARGLERIQGVLVNDQKMTSYKFALIRSLCAVSRVQAQSVVWHGASVRVPMRLITRHWLAYYAALLTGPTAFPQHRGNKRLAFEADLRGIVQSASGTLSIYDLMVLFEQDSTLLQPVLEQIAKAVRDGPVKHAGGTTAPVFTFKEGQRRGALHGFVVIPTDVWLDISRFEHWIEESLVLRWAELTQSFTAAQYRSPEQLGQIITALLATPEDIRDTSRIRSLVNSSLNNARCVWSTDVLGSHPYQVDHIIPYAVWRNNSLWNLMPATPKLNQKKRDRLPSAALLSAQKAIIVDYWQRYHDRFGNLFQQQVLQSLGADSTQVGWEDDAFAGMYEIIERLARTRGIERWDG